MKVPETTHAIQAAEAAETAGADLGQLTSARSIAIVQHLADYGPCDLADVVQMLVDANANANTNTGDVGDVGNTAVRQTLRLLCIRGYIHRELIHDELHWKAGPDPEDVPEPVLAVAPPRRINVMAGVYQPTPGPVLRAGADHRHIQSRGHRC